jgi:hypothetical protein
LDQILDDIIVAGDAYFDTADRSKKSERLGPGLSATLTYKEVKVASLTPQKPEVCQFVTPFAPAKFVKNERKYKLRCQKNT